MASVAPSTQVDVLDHLFQGLRSKSSEVRQQSAIELQHYVCSNCMPRLVSSHCVDLKHHP